MNLYSIIYYIVREVRNSLLDNKNRLEDKNNITTKTSNDSKPDFDSSDNDKFDPILRGNYNVVDNNMNFD